MRGGARDGKISSKVKSTVDATSVYTSGFKPDIFRFYDQGTKMSSSNGHVLEANRLAGTRLELLLFRLEGRQTFGINVFKVQEIIPYQRLTRVVGTHPLVKGIANLRGITMPILDLSEAVGGPPMREPQNGNIIITEYNRSTHGFLVREVARIANTVWEEVLPKPSAVGHDSFVTAITDIDGEMVEILDVEKVLDQVVHASTSVSETFTGQRQDGTFRVLVVDDSMVARRQITDALAQVGVECITANNGQEGIQVIEKLLAEGVDVASYFFMIISDIEMPEMDGYMLTQAIRSHSELQSLYILLHSSISGVFNVDMVKKTGANKFIQKYDADDLAETVVALMPKD